MSVRLAARSSPSEEGGGLRARRLVAPSALWRETPGDASLAGNKCFAVVRVTLVGLLEGEAVQPRVCRGGDAAHGGEVEASR